MQKATRLLLISLFGFTIAAHSQSDSDVFYKGAIKENREILQRNTIQNGITRNLSLPLNDGTEENWMNAFWAMELIKYRSPWCDSKVWFAFDSIDKRTVSFQRALLELAYARYPHDFLKQVEELLNSITNSKIYAMCAEYLLANNKAVPSGSLAKRKQGGIQNEKDEAIGQQLLYHLNNIKKPANPVSLAPLLDPSFLKNNIILYSFQRKNRDYPGVAMIRDSAGNFITDDSGKVFWVTQLARSVSNLPGYLTNGNTPQGIYRMFGFAISKSDFIGPSPNIQLTMPYETSLRHFLNDSTIADTVWTAEWYAKLLPSPLKNFQPLYESFYAGKAGRTEIIAHGTTIDPQYYKGEPFYPQTPTMGCLCTMELWSAENGRRLDSDQQKLVNALQKAGGATGYCVVLELNDEQKPVSLNDILRLISNK